MIELLMQPHFTKEEGRSRFIEPPPQPLGLPALMRGPTGQMRGVPAEGMVPGIPTMLPPIPSPYFEPEEYPHPGYPEGSEPPRQKKRPPPKRKDDDDGE